MTFFSNHTPLYASSSSSSSASSGAQKQPTSECKKSDDFGKFGSIGIVGLAGRMGQRVVDALEAAGFLGPIWGYDVCTPEKGQLCSTLAEVFQKSDVVIDFSCADLFSDLMRAAQDHAKPVMIGTTGISDSGIQALDRLAQRVPVLIAPNTSLGAVVQRWLAKKAALLLPESYDIDILEAHHRYKKDLPSGTAMALGNAIVDAKQSQGVSLHMGQATSPRQDHRIEMHALRCGHVPGQHEVIWTSQEERIVIAHQVFSAHVFATGVVVALRWLSGIEKPGLYSMENVLGLDAVTCPPH